MSAACQQTIPVAAFSQAREAFDKMIVHLQSPEALAMPHEQLEEYLVRDGREVQRRMFQGHLDLRAAAEPRIKAVTGADGTERTTRRRLGRGLLSLVGPVEAERRAYQADGAGALFPLDASLNFPPELYSLGVRRRVAEETARGAFDEVVAALGKTTGAPVPKRQVEQLAVRAAVDFYEFYAGPPMNDVESAKAAMALLLVLTFDGAGVVMRRGDLRPATRKAAEKKESDPRWPRKRLSKGEKKNRKRMAEVAAVYDIAPFPRETDDIVHDLRPVREATPKKPRPRPAHKRVWASLEKEMQEVVDEAFREALGRDPDHPRRWVVLVDGNKDQIACVRRAAAKVGAKLTILLDVIHVLEYLWKAAYCFHKDGTPEAEQWVTKRLRMLLDGVSASEVAAGMTRSATLHLLAKREAVDVCAKYLCKHRDLLHYAEALRDGLPIATGVIEGACRYLVRDRMDRTGARWSLRGAEAVLKLRAICAGGDFDAYWQFHLQAEYQRNHASKYRGEAVPPTLPASKPGGHLRRVK